MGDVIQLAERLRALLSDGNNDYEEFLLEEGLELLAAYRSIENADMRKALLQFIKTMVQNQNRATLL